MMNDDDERDLHQAKSLTTRWASSLTQMLKETRMKPAIQRRRWLKKPDPAGKVNHDSAKHTYVVKSFIKIRSTNWRYNNHVLNSIGTVYFTESSHLASAFCCLISIR